MAAMQERIRGARSNWSRPDVKLDVERLEAEQTERRGLVEAALRSRRPTDWQAVQVALSRTGSAGSG